MSSICFGAGDMLGSRRDDWTTRPTSFELDRDLIDSGDSGGMAGRLRVSSFELGGIDLGMKG